MRAFDAGWGGVVTKTIGLHPVVNVAGPKTKFLRATPDSPHLSMQKRPGHGPPLVVELGAHLGQAARLVDPAHRAHQARLPRRDPRRLDHGGLGQRRGARALADARQACQDAGADALELNLSCPHMDRKDMGSNIGKDERADLDRHAGRQGSRARAGLGQAHAVDHRHRRRSARRRFSAAPTPSHRRTRFPRCRSSTPTRSSSS